MKLASGYNRVVLLIGSYAIKFPNPASQRQFIHGMTCNLKELETFRNSRRDPRLMTIYSIGFLGLWMVCKRYEALGRELTDAELATVPLSEIDNRAGNFAIEDGRVITLDYGYDGTWFIGVLEGDGRG